MKVRDAVQARYSSRYYLPNKPIPQVDMDLVLTAGRKAPSGMGTEPWKFIVITGDMAKLKEATNNQGPVAGASAVIALVNYTTELIQDKPELVTEKFKQSGFTDEKIEMYMPYLMSKGTQYFREQLMIASGQMVLQATELGIGTTIVGGYNPQKMGELLGLDPKYYEVGLLITMGYPSKERSAERVIRSEEDVVEYFEL